MKKQHNVGCDKCFAGVLNENSLSMSLFPAVALEENEWCDCHSGIYLRSLVSQWAKYDQTIDAHEIAKTAKKNQLMRLFERSGIPRQFQNDNFSFSSWNSKTTKDNGKDRIRHVVMEFFENGCIEEKGELRFGIFAYGPSDMGKTGVLVPLFKHFIQQGHIGLLIRYNAMMEGLRAYDEGSDLVRNRFDRLCSTALLFIDELGNPGDEKRPTDYERRMVFELLSERRDQQLPTFITSNMSLDELAQIFETRTVKRLLELCADCPVGGEPMGVLRGIQF